MRQAVPGQSDVTGRGLPVLAAVAVAFLAVAVQLLRLALVMPEPRAGAVDAATSTWSRPDIADRNGRLLATDIEVHSLFADPAVVLERAEVAERLGPVLAEPGPAEIERLLADRQRRFVWLRRGLGPRQAQRIHDLGLPGLGFRRELQRVYPAGALAGHVLGAVNIDNRGLSGIERWLDEAGRAAPAPGGKPVETLAERLSLDIGAQHGVEAELAAAIHRYGARAASAVVLDAATGEVLAAASLPAVDPARPADALDPDRADRLASGVYELGSIFKTLTIAQALEAGDINLDTLFDVREPLKAGPFTIRDFHPSGRALSVREIFLHSSNVGAGMLALRGGNEAQRDFLARLGLLAALRTEAGPVAPPLAPQAWGKAETITIAYGHGLAVAPLQFAAALATLVNGGTDVRPTYRRQDGREPGARLLSEATSQRIRELLRLNVTHPAGTGRRAEAEAAGYRIGGKTGTAEMAGAGGYQKKAVISSFAAAFPMDAPRYVLLVLLFEPQAQTETRGGITAGLNAAPVAGRIVARIAPILGVLPRLASVRQHAGDDSLAPQPDVSEQSTVGQPQLMFDALGDAQ